jgi:acetyl esterase
MPTGSARSTRRPGRPAGLALLAGAGARSLRPVADAVVAAAYDVLRDDDVAFVARLKKAGVDVTLRLVDGVNHGFMGAPNPPPAVAETLSFVRDWFMKVADAADSSR